MNGASAGVRVEAVNRDELQGYLFSKPATIDVVEQYLREKKTLAMTAG